MKFYDVTTFLTIAINILLNISRSKDNQTMKFGQLIEYIRNIFLEKSYTNHTQNGRGMGLLGGGGAIDV